MKVAVTYENGEVFQHFGHSEAFKLYEVEGGEVKSSEVVPTNGSGHGALAGFLRERGVEVLNKTNKRSTLKIKSVNTEKSERVMIYKIGCSFYVLKELILKFKERKRG